MKELVDFAMLRSPSLPCDGRAHQVHRRPMSLHLTAMYLKYTCLEDRVALLREIHPVKATLLHRPPFVAAYGGTMSEVTVRGLV